MYGNMNPNAQGTYQTWDQLIRTEANDSVQTQF